MHTKGKWKVDKSGLRIRCRAGLIASCESEVRQGIIPEDEHLANARLMAAAPEMLAACEMIKKRLLTHGEWNEGCFYYANRSASELEEPLELLAAAIAKAKGGEL